MSNENKSSITDVLSGNESLKFEIGLKPSSILYLAAGIVAAVAVSVLFIRSTR